MSRLAFYSLTLCSVVSSYALWTQAQPFVEQGKTIIVNGKSFKVAWRQWLEGNITHLGISDPGLQQVLGVESLSNTSHDLQPVEWFGVKKELKVSFNNPYRYLDVTSLISDTGIETKTNGDSLILNAPVTKIKQIQQTQLKWGTQIVLELDSQTVWQVNQNTQEATISLAGVPTAEVITSNKTSPQSDQRENILKDDLGVEETQPNLVKIALNLEVTPKNTQIKFNLPAGYGVRVSGVNKPNRLVIDLRPDAMSVKKIKWHGGLTLHQEYINLSTGNTFPITYLEIDPKIFSFKPIVSSSQSLTGLASLIQMFQKQAVAGINGGFFNRNTQQPLGAIKRDNIWLSSPILNRGAIAWDSQGNFKVGRLSLKETLSNNAGLSIPILSLNSGYVQAGLSRYTPEWGKTYTPMTDNEIVFLVENEQIIDQVITNGSKTEIAIAKNGYLLVQRGQSLSLDKNSPVRISSQTIPESFSNYPNILSAGPLLIEGGKIVLDAASERFNPTFQLQNASRSGIGITSKKTILLVAVHNRLTGPGSTLIEYGQLMQRLGAVEALNLDGGSSTSLYLGGQVIDRPPSTPAKVHNGLGLFKR